MSEVRGGRGEQADHAPAPVWPHPVRRDDVWSGEIHTAETPMIDLGPERLGADPTVRIDLPPPAPADRRNMVGAAPETPAAQALPHVHESTQPLHVSQEPTQAMVVAHQTPVGGIPRVRAPRRRRRRVLLALLVLFLLGAGYYGVTLYQVHETGQSDQSGALQRFDAIVVMGAAQYDCRPTPQLQARLDHALDLWNSGVADRMVVTGGNQPGDRCTEAGSSRAFFEANGVDGDDILEEDASHNSYDALVGVEDILDDIVRARVTVLIVTDPYHSLRSRLTADEIGLKAYVSPTRTSPVVGGNARKREMREAFGVALGRIIGFRRLLSITG